MKRSPLNRRTPMKRTKLQPVSAKTKAMRNEMKPYRTWLKTSARCCMKCRKPAASAELDVHEIPAGAHRDRALQNPWTWLVLCRDCHNVLQGIDPKLQVEVLFGFVTDGVNDCYGRKVLEPIPRALGREAI